MLTSKPERSLRISRRIDLFSEQELTSQGLHPSKYSE